MTEQNSFDQVVSQIAPMYTFEGIAFYNICDVIRVLETGGAMVDGGSYAPFNAMMILEAAETLDAVIFSYPREYPGFRPTEREGIAVALRNTKRAVIWEDLS